MVLIFNSRMIMSYITEERVVVYSQMAWKITLRFRGPNALCKLVAYVQVVAMFAAAYVLVATAVDRYIAVCHPLQTHVWTPRRMHLLVTVSWLASLTFALPQLVVFAKRQVAIDVSDHLVA